MKFEIAIVLISGFILDAILGDPEFIPHPVVIIGKLINTLEPKLRNLFPKTPTGERAAGVVLALLSVGVSTIIPLLVILALGKISIWLKLALEVFWCWQILAMKSLKNEAIWVYEKVISGDLQAARMQVARIVGRDTTNLSMKEIIKACIETVAESTSDGVIAPLFFMAVGGVPFGFFYKATNTLDSMVGYKSDKYRYFGTASAKLDDLLNLIPSRLTALFMVASSKILGFNSENAMAMWRRDGSKHLSPNSGNPESATAGALEIQLGGDAYYFGKRYEKATLGDPLREPEAEDILRAVKLMELSSVIALVLFSIFLAIITSIF